MDGYLTQKGRQLIENGYSIIPIPGGGKFPTEKGWQKIVATPKLWRGWVRNGYAEAGVGIICGLVIGLDIDARHGEMAIWAENTAYDTLGLAPARIGEAPKRMLVYRTETPFASFSSRAFKDENGEKNQVDVIAGLPGSPKQFVAYHIHPVTGKPYYWIQGYDLVAVPVVELIVVTEAEIRAFLAAFEAEAIRRGCKGRIDGVPARQSKSVPVG